MMNKTNKIISRIDYNIFAFFSQKENKDIPPYIFM